MNETNQQLFFPRNSLHQVLHLNSKFNTIIWRHLQEKPDYENAIFLIKIFTDRFIEAPVDDSGSILPVGKCHFKVKHKDKENFADLAVLSVLLTLSRYLTSLNHPTSKIYSWIIHWCIQNYQAAVQIFFRKAVNSFTKFTEETCKKPF